jgi:methylated-DNA-[protein]-cysteine S-methyltransferase
LSAAICCIFTLDLRLLLFIQDRASCEQKHLYPAHITAIMLFREKCLKLIEQIPPGKVTTYRCIAEALHTKAYRAVGTAMRMNPYAPHVPCHRVIRSDGTLGGYAHGTRLKKELLLKEGINIHGNRVEKMEKVLFRFSSSSSS